MFKQIFLVLRKRVRDKRYRTISSLLSLETRQGMVLDLGGGPGSFFAAMYPKPSNLILLEIMPEVARMAKKHNPNTMVIVADGERQPFADDSIMITLSNSVIEHVQNPMPFANEIQRVSKSFFVQTPNGNFPLETHSFIAIPFYRYFPAALKPFVCRVFRANYEYIDSVRYLSEKTLKLLFPPAMIMYEKVLWLKKSFYLISNNGQQK